MNKKLEIIVPENVIRTRLEEYLFDTFPSLSRMYLRDVIKSGNCEVNGKIENKGKRISSGDFIEIEIDEQRETAMRPEDLPLDIVFEDDDLILINKPAGLLVHPTHRDKSGTLLNALAFYLNKEIFLRGSAEPERDDLSQSKIQNRKSKIIRPGLIHRLDKETSGLLLVAKNTRSHRILAKQFRLKTVTKKYLALVCGLVEQNNGVINETIGRFPEEKRWGVKADGKPAETRFKVIERRQNTTLLELIPITGRTNQLRIHCAAIGHPILGDVDRGGREHERLCLHAAALSFTDMTGKRRSFQSDYDFDLMRDTQTAKKD
ncbi:MAG: RluA family pseudouridine synthase [Pyrinomonadaceae bacterium]